MTLGIVLQLPSALLHMRVPHVTSEYVEMGIYAMRCNRRRSTCYVKTVRFS